MLLCFRYVLTSTSHHPCRGRLTTLTCLTCWGWEGVITELSCRSTAARFKTAFVSVSIFLLTVFKRPTYISEFVQTLARKTNFQQKAVKFYWSFFQRKNIFLSEFKGVNCIICVKPVQPSWNWTFSVLKLTDAYFTWSLFVKWRSVWDWYIHHQLKRACTGGNNASVIAVGGLRRRHSALISEKGRSNVRDRVT